ncbi:Tetratricopeptide repeat protein [Durusdinium trenchii]|uniref:Tetratricopeptide repeat protein n=1 Tax=Durusdinium trenchii TaxID=1381693 RepID=A0ABP0R177_9DINO
MTCLWITTLLPDRQSSTGHQLSREFPVEQSDAVTNCLPRSRSDGCLGQAECATYSYLSLTCVLCVVLACGWFAFAAGFARANERGEPTPAHSKSVANESVKGNPLERVIAELEVLQARSSESKPLVPYDLSVLPFVEEVFLGTTNAYSAQGIRYLTVRLTLANQSDEVIEVEPAKILLKADAQTLRVDEIPEGFSYLPLQTDGETKPREQLRVPEKVSIAPRKDASFWLVYGGIRPWSRIPRLKLEGDLGNEAFSIDLTSFEKARLGLRESLVGPANVVTLLTIRGHLNTVNAGFLADRLSERVESGSPRVVVQWQAATGNARQRDVDPLLLEWLATLGPESDRGGPLLAQLPSVTLTPTQLHFVAIPSESQNALADSEGISIHVSRDDAVEAMSVDQLPRYLDDPDPAIIRAISCLATPEVGPFLENAVSQGETVGIRVAALRGLLKSSSPWAISLAEKLLSQPLNIPDEDVIAALAASPRRAWAEILVSYCHSEKPGVRGDALLRLAQIGYPDLLAIATSGLKDDNETVRSTAYRVLVDLPSVAAQEAAFAEALRRLQRGELDKTTVRVIQATRDVRAAKPLLRLLDDAGQSPRRILSLLGHVADAQSVRYLLSRLNTFETEDRINILQLAVEHRLDAVMGIAERWLGDDDVLLTNAAIVVLREDGSRQAVDLLAGALAKADEADAPKLCDALAEIATPRAADILKSYRDRTDEPMRSAVFSALREIQARSPGFSSVETGYHHMQAENWGEAVKHFSLAIAIDPHLPLAFSGRGNARLRLEQVVEAGEDFRQAIELDPYDGQAVTGLGIVTALSGQPEHAMQIVIDAAPRFPDDDVYAYNLACVAGRAIEALQNRPASADRDRLIEEYADRAIGELRRSIELGFDDFALLKNDPDLDTLRDHDEFPEP